MMGSQFYNTVTQEKIKVMEAYVRGEAIESRSDLTGGKWADVKTPKWQWLDRRYRIKPKKPKFKVGDWVFIDEEEVAQISVNHLNGQYNITYPTTMAKPSGESIGYLVHEDSLTLWTPKEGALVMYLRSTQDANIIVIKRFKGSFFTGCIPYIGQSLKGIL